MSKPNFTGSWTHNPERSKLEIPMPTYSLFHFEHEGPTLRLTRTLTFGDKGNTITLDLVIDGEEHLHQVAGVNANIRMYWDGDTLVGDMKVSGPDGDATNVVRYWLEDDGLRLVALERFNSPQQNYENTWVLDRQ